MEYENIIFDMSFLESESVDVCSQKYLLPVINDKIKLPSYIKKSSELYFPIIACLDASDCLYSTHISRYELGVKGI